MKRTQVYIDFPTYRKAKAVANLSGQTLSGLIRTSLAGRVNDKRVVNSLELVANLSKKFKPLPGTPRDLSVNLDKYLYDPANN